jgi:hypothetical protein
MKALRFFAILDINISVETFMSSDIGREIFASVSIGIPPSPMRLRTSMMRMMSSTL